MSVEAPTSDSGLLDLLRIAGPLGVAELSHAMEVTPTAVRQRLVRLLSQESIQREAVRRGRGRPKHRYWLTEKGVRLTGSKLSGFGDGALDRGPKNQRSRASPGGAPPHRPGVGRRLRQPSPGNHRRGTDAIRGRTTVGAEDSGLGRELGPGAGAHGPRLPISQVGRQRSGNLRRGSNDVFRVARPKRDAHAVPPRKGAAANSKLAAARLYSAVRSAVWRAVSAGPTWQPAVLVANH